MQNYQATHAPYAADVLRPHDQQLIFQREFGTEVNPDPGDTFNTENGGPALKWRRDPRSGSLEVFADSNVPDFAQAKGQSFLIPDWTQGPDYLPDVGAAEGQKAVAVIGRFRCPSPPTPISDYLGGIPGVGLVLGQENLVGDVEDTNFTLVELRPDQEWNVNPPVAPPPWDAPGGFWVASPSYVRTAEFEANPVQPNPPIEQSAAARSAPIFGGMDVYLKAFCLWSEKQGSTSVFAACSQNGLAWSPCGFGEVEGNVMRRIGISVRAANMWGAVDWLRVYQLTFPGTEAELAENMNEAMLFFGAQTGGRLYG